MRPVLTLASLAAAVAAAPRLASLDPVTAAILGVLGGIALSVLLAGRLSPEAVGLGAVGALGHGWLLLGAGAPALATGVLLAFAYGARAARSRGVALNVFQIGVALGCGIAGSAVVLGYLGAAPHLALAAIAVGTLVAAAPLALPVDDPIAHELLGLARQSSGTVRTRLLRGVALRRRVDELSPELSRQAEKRLEKAYRAFVKTARARVGARPASAVVLDKQLAAYVKELQRAHRAASNTRALTDGVDDNALAGLRLEGEDLEVTASALVEAEQELEAVIPTRVSVEETEPPSAPPPEQDPHEPSEGELLARLL